MHRRRGQTGAAAVGSGGRPKPQIGGLVFLFVIALVIGAFDVFVVNRLIDRVRTYGFAGAPAEVIESYVEEFVAGRRGQRSHSAVVRYTYQANGRTFEGLHDDRDGAFSAGRAESAAVWVVGRHPPGQRFTVFYDRSDPYRSVMVRGVRGEDLALVQFATPFNLVVCGMVVMATASLRTRRPTDDGHGPGHGTPVREVDGRLHVRLSTVPPDAAPTLLATSVAALLSTILVGITWSVLGDVDLPHWLPISGLGWTVLAGVYVYGRTNPGWARTGGELVVDPAAKTLTLPASARGGAPKVIRFSQVKAVRGTGRADSVAAWGRSGVFHPTVAWQEERDGKRVRESMPLGATADRPAADRFAGWLEKRVGLRK